MKLKTKMLAVNASAFVIVFGFFASADGNKGNGNKCGSNKVSRLIKWLSGC